MQLVLESPIDRRQYKFELNDRLIRDKELDGFTEIPVAPDTSAVQRQNHDTDDAGEQQHVMDDSVSSKLPGMFSQPPYI